MSIVQITDKIFFERSEFASCQEEIVRRDMSRSISDENIQTVFEGSVITLKNGRKIYVEGMTPAQILEKVSP